MTRSYIFAICALVSSVLQGGSCNIIHIKNNTEYPIPFTQITTSSNATAEDWKEKLTKNTIAEISEIKTFNIMTIAPSGSTTITVYDTSCLQAFNMTRLSKKTFEKGEQEYILIKLNPLLIKGTMLWTINSDSQMKMNSMGFEYENHQHTLDHKLDAVNFIGQRIE